LISEHDSTRREEVIEINLNSLLPEVETQEDGCIQRLQNILIKKEGVLDVHLNELPSSIQLCLHYDPSVLPDSEIHKLVQKTSSRIAKRYRHSTLAVDGMDCSDCAFVLEHGLSRLDGILMVSVSYADQQIQVEYDNQQISLRDIVQSIRRLGYSVPRTGYLRSLQENQALILSLLSGFFLLIAWGSEQFFRFPQPLILAAYALSFLLGGFHLLIRSLPELLRERRVDIDILMLVAAVGAATLGKYSEGAFLLFLFSLGHSLEARATNRARKAILSLADMAPRIAHVRRNGREEIRPIEEIQIGDLVFIPPGSKIPVDGTVELGTSSIDLSAITGEPMPVDIKEKDEVFAGAMNGQGALEVVATRLAKDSTLSKVIQMVQKAQAQQSPSEVMSRRIIRILVPGILITDVLLILIPPLLGVPFKESFLRAMTLLVAASPCALALGTPSAILSSLARAARSGILIKAGAHIENLGNLKAIAFDKTGTITTGKPNVTDIFASPPYKETEILRWAAVIEQRSAHPLAHAIVDAAIGQGLELPSPSSVEADTGKGITAKLEEDIIWIGKANHSDENGIEVGPDIRSTIKTFESQRKTTIVVRINSKTAGVIALTDQVRPEAKSAITALGANGIDHMILLTGDNAKTAEHIATQVGLKEFHAQLMPEEKLQILSDLEKKYQKIAMVGDGVNDAPALANATVGIAMGGARTQVALETADVVLMSDDLSKLPFVINLGRKTTTIIKQNFIIALSVMASLILLTLFDLTGIGSAILLHEGTTLLVVINSLRLLTYRVQA